MSAERIRAISDEALSLARHAAGAAPSDADTERAAALATELAGLRSDVDSAVGHDAEGLTVAFSEGMVDLDWVMSGGRTPASIRLTVVLRGGAGLPPTSA